MAGEEVKRDRMVAAIQGGDPPDTLVQAIRKSEGRLAEFHAELKRLESMPNLEMLGLPAMEAAIGKELSRFADLLTGNVPLARQGLKKLLVDSIDFLPRESATGKQTSVFKTTLSYGAIVQGGLSMNGVPSGIRGPVEGGDRRDRSARLDGKVEAKSCDVAVPRRGADPGVGGHRPLHGPNVALDRRGDARRQLLNVMGLGQVLGGFAQDLLVGRTVHHIRTLHHEVLAPYELLHVPPPSMSAPPMLRPPSARSPVPARHGAGVGRTS
ncbi:MAG: hypothetical protein H6Q86_5296, partial [candidate division NC10 bacterium]|nr:hypothetical protein [candidate division NC10 bacterium]